TISTPPWYSDSTQKRFPKIRRGILPFLKPLTDTSFNPLLNAVPNHISNASADTLIPNSPLFPHCFPQPAVIVIFFFLQLIFIYSFAYFQSFDYNILQGPFK